MTAPLYVRIRREIEARIRAGELPPGARLPTEKDLTAQYGVSRATAQRVLSDLAEAGLAIRRRRHGTFVADVTRQIDLLNFVTPATAARGTPGRHDVVSAHSRPALPLGAAGARRDTEDRVARRHPVTARGRPRRRAVLCLLPRLAQRGHPGTGSGTPGGGRDHDRPGTGTPRGLPPQPVRRRGRWR
ncbi:GntR family transcriptional regulator [Streptomyces scabiei]|uniref:GntR family transcriptional regulator n=1 Tax=Streptomyces scabiei TaxID=1930 RepID=UPI00298FF73F|nr:GntR family transcriptional regulator [Streptomyces scabiei]MDW8808473.1 GntR family transcriptional regulator [Streptomyces scabiei]